MERCYLIIDLKSFYASCECVARGLPAMTTDLVVADPARGDGTICLAVSPSLKAKGVRNRCRFYEIPKNLRFITAEPRMQLYINYAAEIYGLYLRYFAPEDIHVYSIDEAFIDVTGYLATMKKTPWELARFLLQELEEKLGLPATCGIGPNLYLAKIALDITAKHAPERIGWLTPKRFVEELAHHRPLTDFWRIGPGIARRLARVAVFDMEGIRRLSLRELKRLFGVNGAILYDHARGIEPTTIADIKAYRPQTRSVSFSQVLMRDYTVEEALVVLKEMADSLALELLQRHVVTDCLSLWVGDSWRQGETSGTPGGAGGTKSLWEVSNSSRTIVRELVNIYEKIVPASSDRRIRRICISAERVIPEGCMQQSLFAGGEDAERERRRNRAILALHDRYGANSVLRAVDFLPMATRRERNEQIGGHKRGSEDATKVQPRENISVV